MVASPVWAFYESIYGVEVIARGVMNEEVFADVQIFPGEAPEKGDMIVANPDFSDQRLMKSDVFAAVFKRIRRDKE